MNERERKKWTVGRVITWVVAIVLISSGLITVGFFLFLTIAMSSYGSNK
jgi:hypothetical protein